jgi:hypothetical protein
VVTGRRLAAAFGLAMLGVLGAVGHAGAHPLHSTITELVLDPARGTVRATVRVFADDLRSAVTRAAHGRTLPPTGATWDAAVVAYATSAIALQDASGRAVRLRPCGLRRTRDLLWICLEGDVARDVRTLQLRNTMLSELYEDQVNVVQGVVGGTRRSLLFVRGDRFKALQ